MAIWTTLIETWGTLSPWTKTTLGAWLLSMILMPILNWRWGDRVVRWGVVASVTLQAGVVLTILGPAWGWAQTVAVGLAIPCMGWAVEFLGSRTGIPFGRYHYTDRLQPQVGHVPVVIPLAWLMMLPPAWALADVVTPTRGIAFVVVSALAFTAWDLFLDPQMVGWKFWVWERPRGYFGIPWVNYLGWALASGIMTALLCPEPLPALPLLLIYALTWLLEIVGLGVFWGQPYPAVVGTLGMGGMLLWAWLSM